MIIFRVNQVFVFGLIISFLKQTVPKITTEIAKALDDTITYVITEEVKEYENQQKKNELIAMLSRIVERSDTTIFIDDTTMKGYDFTETNTVISALLNKKMKNVISNKSVKGVLGVNFIAKLLTSLIKSKKKIKTGLHEPMIVPVSEESNAILTFDDDEFINKIRTNLLKLLGKHHPKLFRKVTETKKETEGEEVDSIISTIDSLLRVNP